MYLLNAVVLHVCVVHVMHVSRVSTHVHLHLFMGIDVPLYELGGGALAVMFRIVRKLGNMQHPLDATCLNERLPCCLVVEALQEHPRVRQGGYQRVGI